MHCARWIVAEAFRVDPEALADVVRRMAEFHRYAENMLAEIDSAVTNLHATWTGEGAGGSCRGAPTLDSRRGDDARGIGSIEKRSHDRARQLHRRDIDEFGHLVMTRLARGRYILRPPAHRWRRQVQPGQARKRPHNIGRIGLDTGHPPVTGQDSDLGGLAMASSDPVSADHAGHVDLEVAGRRRQRRPCD